MDEDNRLVIAEKQRRYRKKTSNNQSTLTGVHQTNPNLYSYQQMQLLQQQPLHPVQAPPPPPPPPPPPEKKKDKKKVFLCSPCGTHYENWNLFLHMREVHRKHICLYCLGIFQSAERLVNHLGTKHGVLKKHHGSLEEYLKQRYHDNARNGPLDVGAEHPLAISDVSHHEAQQQPFYLMCSRCEHMFESNTNDLLEKEEQLRAHDCANYLETCGNCGQLKQTKHRCDGANGSRLDKSYVHLQGLPPVANGELNHQKEYVPSSVNDAATPPSHVPVPSVPSLLPTVDQKTDEPQPPPLVVTPLVPKLKVKIPIQYLTPMESEESSEESDDEEEDDDEDEDAEDENEDRDDNKEMAGEDEEEEIEEANAQKEQTETMEQGDGKDVMLPSTIVSDQPIEGKNDPSDEHTNDTHRESEQELNKPHSIEVAEDTALQEPIPMDIDESLMIERRRDVPTRASMDSKHQNQFETPEKVFAPGGEVSSMAAENDSTAPFSDGSASNAVAIDSVKEENVSEKTEPPNDLPNTIDIKTDQNEAVTGLAQVGEMVKARVENEENERLAAAEMLYDMSTTGGEAMASDTIQPCEDTPTKDDMIIADSDSQLFTLTLDEPLDRIPIREFIRICLRVTVPFCLYCNHARRIAVNGRQLVLHIIAMHRFQATVNSITGEELLPETILQRFINSLDELEADHAYLNVETFDNSWTVEQRTAVPFVKLFECFQCRFTTVVHKELYLHNRKMHQKAVLLCLMCKGTFFSYSELLCHMCPGVSNHTTALDYTFRCCVCNVDGIPSAFRLMVHLRKRHYACDVCLEECLDQSRLSNHVWKHKLHHLCYRCGIGYRNKADILKHLFWKHGTEGVLCKRCLQKKWPHVYHFCVPPAQFVCEVCQATFNRSVALKVHRRLHNGDSKYPCTEDGCEKRFISKKLLLKHVQRHYLEKVESVKETVESIMDVNSPSSVEKNAHVSKVEGSISTSDVEATAVSDTVALKTESLADDTEGSVAKISDISIAEGGGSEGGNSEAVARSMEESADKDTIKKVVTETPKLDDGKNGGSLTVDNIEDPLQDSNGKESVKEQAIEATAATAASEEPMNVSTTVKKSKRKRKAKDDDKSVVDLMNLPALNLSESDSSDDSDNESSNASFNSRRMVDVTETESGSLRDDPMESSQSTKVDDASLTHTEDAIDQQNSSEDVQQRKDGVTTEEEEVTEPSENSSQEVVASMDPIASIWNNFKRYQAHHRTASRKQSADEEQRLEDELVDRMLKTTILHVSQSDHDYCMMFKPILSEGELEAEMHSKPQQESLLLKGGRDAEESIRDSSPRSPEKTVKSSGKRNDNQSSDSEDSSDSDSSCECGSNCSCSSSSSNSSSSSSDDSDSSDNENARKEGKKATSQPKKDDEADIVMVASAAEDILQIEPQEVVEELPPPEPVDPDSVIVDSDLHTDESETDEEFYDEHPQKLANQLLAEKRRQLLAQTGVSNVMMNYGMVENSRPSTPSLPPEEAAQGKKKLKPKKRKRERKSSKRFMSPASSTFVEQRVPATTATAVPTMMDVVPYVPPHINYTPWPLGEQQTSGFVSTVSAELGPATVAAPSVHNFDQQQQQMLPVTTVPMEMQTVMQAIPVQPTQPTVAGDDMGTINAPSRLSTGNSSESDAPLKRSQRSRKPNKFYGYTSDDESAAGSLPLPSGITLSTNPEKSILSLMKPTPPPNLVWSKEDLPSPPTKSSKGAGAGGAGVSGKMSSGQRRSVDHLTPVSSRRNSGIGMSQDELGAMPPAVALAEQQYPTNPQLLQTQTPMVVSSLLASFDPSTPTSQNHPPLPKLKLSLGKKSSIANVTPKGVKQAANSRRRKPTTPRTPKVKTPKSAPPIGATLHGSMMLPIGGTPGTPGPLSAPLVPAAGGVASSTPYPTPSAVESRPKIPPIGSFPSIQTDLFRPNQIRVPAGWRAPKEGESVYCYCRAPYDEVSEMIACDDDNCRIEWFHFECVGIIMPPKGKWFCPDCKLRQVQSGTVLASGAEGEQ
uniref:Uncharacterized protein n=1 Tax=Anopheles epiroticus TaxID=199890 RepID=A0A182PKF2_9DIPT